MKQRRISTAAASLHAKGTHARGKARIELAVVDDVNGHSRNWNSGDPEGRTATNVVNRSECNAKWWPLLVVVQKKSHVAALELFIIKSALQRHTKVLIRSYNRKTHFVFNNPLCFRYN